MQDVRQVFTKIHDENLWKGASKSGTGSTKAVTELLRNHLSAFFAEADIQVLCDAPCGTAEWISDITAGLRLYLGLDVVEELISNNAREHRRANQFFKVADVIVDPLPRSDAIFCRDCLVHLSLEQAQQVIRNFKASGSTYLLATTFPDRTENRQAQTGRWRALNLCAEPFNFPEPWRLMRERHPNPADKNNDKSIGVWRLADLPD